MVDGSNRPIVDFPVSDLELLGKTMFHNLECFEEDRLIKEFNVV
jgi:hypothetical protein